MVYLYPYHVFLFNIKKYLQIELITVVRDHDNIHRITKNETWPSQLWDHDRLHFNLKQRWLNYPLSAFLSAAQSCFTGLYYQACYATVRYGWWRSGLLLGCLIYWRYFWSCLWVNWTMKCVPSVLEVN